MIIKTMADLYQLFHPADDTFQSLNRRIYKDTECGASISVYGMVDGAPVEYHNGRRDPLPDNFVLEKFTIQTIVEGSEATVDSDAFVAGVVTDVDVNQWIAHMEGEADRLWEEANGESEDHDH